MRDPARIDTILAALRATWEKHPDERLGQLIVNVSGRSDPFYVEDDKMLAAIQADCRER